MTTINMLEHVINIIVVNVTSRIVRKKRIAKEMVVVVSQGPYRTAATTISEPEPALPYDPSDTPAWVNEWFRELMKDTHHE